MKEKEHRMSQHRFDVSENVQIEIRACEARVSVTGWDDAHTVLADAAARQEGDRIVVEHADRVNLRVPRSAAVTITDCEGDVRVDDLAGRVELAQIEGDVALRNLDQVLVRDLEGELIARGVSRLSGQGTWEGDVALRGVERLDVETIEGDASLGDAGEVTIRTVEGDLSARQVRTALRIDDVQGDVALRGVGDVSLAHVGGDLAIAEAFGTIDSADVEGDAVVSIDTIKTVTLRADGDVALNLPEHADAEIELDAPHGHVVGHAHQVTEQDDDHLRGTLGAGGPRVQAESTHEDVVLRVGGTADEPRERRRHRLAHVHWARMGQRIAEKTEQAVMDSLRDVEESFGRSKRRERRHESHGAPAPEEPRGPAAGSPERKAILDAIARGELSVDEAIQKLRGEE